MSNRIYFISRIGEMQITRANLKTVLKLSKLCISKVYYWSNKRNKPLAIGPLEAARILIHEEGIFNADV